MGARGPAPTPSIIKERRGTYRPDRAPKNEATPNLASGEQLKAPDWLSEGAREKWEELALRLHNQGLLTELDLDIFAAYCTAWTQLERRRGSDPERRTNHHRAIGLSSGLSPRNESPQSSRRSHQAQRAVGFEPIELAQG